VLGQLRLGWVVRGHARPQANLLPVGTGVPPGNNRWCCARPRACRLKPVTGEPPGSTLWCPPQYIPDS